MVRAILRNVIAAAALLAMYFAAPVPRESSLTGLKIALLVAAAGVYQWPLTVTYELPP